MQMKTFIKRALLLTLSVVILVGNASAQETKEITKTFKNKKAVRIRTVSGDCIVKKGQSDEICVDLVYSVYPEDAFEPEIDERGSTLEIRERWWNASRGRVKWTLTVPEKTEIRFSTASGDLSVQGLKSSIDANTASGDVVLSDFEGGVDIITASGDVELENCRGEFELSTASGEIDANNVQGKMEMSTASGDIDVANSQGRFDLSCASGSIYASDIIVEDASSFSTASGKVYVSVGKTPEFDLELSAASGRVTLDYQGNPMKGYFEFIAREDRGDIRAPFQFDNVEEFYRHDRLYIKKSATIGTDVPKIQLSTASGSAVLKQ